MTSGKTMPDVKSSFFVFLLLIATTVHSRDDYKLQQLLAPFAETKQLKLAYQEKRFSLFFKQPQVYHGYIEYLSPDTFIKQIQSPVRKKIVIVQNQLTLYTYDSETVSDSEAAYSDKKIVSLDDYPQFKQLKALFSGLFQGKASELTRYYRYEIKSLANEHTSLILKPNIADRFTQDSLQQNSINKQIEIIFHKQRITKIKMTGFGGERSELLFRQEVLKQEVFKQEASEHDSL